MNGAEEGREEVASLSSSKQTEGKHLESTVYRAAKDLAITFYPPAKPLSGPQPTPPAGSSVPAQTLMLLKECIYIALGKNLEVRLPIN